MMQTRYASLIPLALFGLSFSACSSPTADPTAVPSEAEIRRFVEGSWQLETWHVDDEILRPPTARGYILFHDGVVLFTVVRDEGDRTLTRFGHGEYQVADGRWSYRYDDNHYMETERPEHEQIFEKSHFSWSEPRQFEARFEDGQLILENEGGKRTMIYGPDTQTYVENGRTVRTWRRR